MDKRSDEELIQVLAQHNERAPDRHRAQVELTRRAVERAGQNTYVWTIVGAVAAVLAAIFAAIALMK